MNRQNIYLSEQDLDGLPSALLEQLSINSRPKIMRRIIMKIIGDGEVTVDEILIRLYREYGKKITRDAALGYLFRFKRAKLICSERHGTYRKLSSG